MKLHATLLAACIAAAAATSASAQTTPAPPPADSAAPAPAPAAPTPRPRVRRNPNLITADEIRGQTATDAYALVAKLRPQWLRGHASNVDLAGRIDPVRAFLDGSPRGEAMELRAVHVSHVVEIRFIPSEEAVMRWGEGFSSGAIMVTTQ